MNCDIFFFNDTATTEIYTLSLHDALPISSRKYRAVSPMPVLRSGRAWPAPRCRPRRPVADRSGSARRPGPRRENAGGGRARRSEEHTSELQSRQYLVCRLLLEKKKNVTL